METMNINRRNFLGSLLALGAGFSILPGAGRVWRVRIDPGASQSVRRPLPEAMMYDPISNLIYTISGRISEAFTIEQFKANFGDFGAVKLGLNYRSPGPWMGVYSGPKRIEPVFLFPISKVEFNS